MKRLQRTIPIRECSPWISWFAWYPVTCQSPQGQYRVWLERIDYRYMLVNGLYQCVYRLPLGDAAPSRAIPIRRPARRRRSS